MNKENDNVQKFIDILYETANEKIESISDAGLFGDITKDSIEIYNKQEKLTEADKVVGFSMEPLAKGLAGLFRN